MPKILTDPFGLVGTTLEGQYRIDDVVGEGGFGVVYRAWHLGLDQPIAIKALKVLDADDEAVQSALLTKFRDEAKLLYTLSQSSLNIVRSIDIGAVTTPSGAWAPYTVLEWLDGISLADDLDARRNARMRGRTLDEALHLLEPAAEGLGVAHHHRVAHRDVKPANFFLRRTPEGPRIKVLDFGIAKIMREGDTNAATKSAFASFTWAYAAPEQLDPRYGATGLATDVYGFALLLTEVLTDREPVETIDVLSIVRAATDPNVRPTPRTRGAMVPDAIEAACRKALAVDPRARFATLPEFWSALTNRPAVAVTTHTATAPRVSIPQPPSLPQPQPPPQRPSALPYAPAPAPPPYAPYPPMAPPAGYPPPAPYPVRRPVQVMSDSPLVVLAIVLFVVALLFSGCLGLLASAC